MRFFLKLFFIAVLAFFAQNAFASCSINSEGGNPGAPIQSASSDVSGCTTITITGTRFNTIDVIELLNIDLVPGDKIVVTGQGIPDSDNAISYIPFNSYLFDKDKKFLYGFDTMETTQRFTSNSNYPKLYFAVIGKQMDGQNITPQNYTYNLQIVRDQNPPALSIQNVVLDFDGGTSTEFPVNCVFLVCTPQPYNRTWDAYSTIWGTNPSGMARAGQISQIRQFVEKIYENYNIKFFVQDTLSGINEIPPSGDFMRIFVTSTNTLPINNRRGASSIQDDTDNKRKNGQAVVSQGAIIYSCYSGNTPAGMTFDDALYQIANIVSHEAGHILGLIHTEQINEDSTLSIMGWAFTCDWPDEKDSSFGMVEFMHSEHWSLTPFVADPGFQESNKLFLDYSLGKGKNFCPGNNCVDMTNLTSNPPGNTPPLLYQTGILACNSVGMACTGIQRNCINIGSQLGWRDMETMVCYYGYEWDTCAYRAVCENACFDTDNGNIMSEYGAVELGERNYYDNYFRDSCVSQSVYRDYTCDGPNLLEPTTGSCSGGTQCRGGYCQSTSNCSDECGPRSGRNDGCFGNFGRWRCSHESEKSLDGDSCYDRIYSQCQYGTFCKDVGKPMCISAAFARDTGAVASGGFFCPNGHTDNGDGTCTAEISDIIEDGYIIGYGSGPIPSTYERHNSEPLINVFGFSLPNPQGYIQKGYIEWDTNSIPIDAEILGVSLKYKSMGGGLLYDYLDGLISNGFVSSRPSVVSNSQMFNNSFYHYYQGPDFITNSPQPTTIELLPVAATDLKSKLNSEKWFAVIMSSGLANGNPTRYISSSEGEFAPTLIVKYSLSGQLNVAGIGDKVRVKLEFDSPGDFLGRPVYFDIFDKSQDSVLEQPLVGIVNENGVVGAPWIVSDQSPTYFFKAWFAGDPNNVFASNILSTTCGNGSIDAFEQCDLGEGNGIACEIGEGAESCVYCSDTCQNQTVLPGICGDGYCNAQETCSSCAADCDSCQLFCGDGVLDTRRLEQCDNGALAGNSCQSLGYESGSLSCCPTCGSFDKSGCGYDLSTCTDNDSGASNQYLVQSTVTGANQTFTGQACDGWANATNTPYTYTDSCSGNILTEWSCTPEIVPSIYDCNAIDCTQFKKPVSQTIDCTAIGWLCGNGKCTGVTGGGGKKGPASPSTPSPNEPIQ